MEYGIGRAGYLIYRFTDLKTTNDVYVMATKYSHEIGYVIIAVVILVVGFIAYKGLKKRRNNIKYKSATTSQVVTLLYLYLN